MKRPELFACCILVVIAPHASIASDASVVPTGWTTSSPRDELKPEFFYRDRGAPDGGGVFGIRHDHREGLDGSWTTTLPVEGGATVRFEVLRRSTTAMDLRQSAVVRLHWQDASGRDVPYDKPVVDFYRSPQSVSMARPEWPRQATQRSDGWISIRGRYRVPAKAAQVQIHLYLKWAPGVTVQWSLPTIETVPASPGRPVRLATVHFQPRGGGSPSGNCRLFEPLIAKAATQQADLVVLPETLTYYGLGKDYAECAEPIPGPSTQYFGRLAKQHDLYIVAGLLERAGHLVYNVAVLIGPDGDVVGKYRKVCLPRGESEGGIAPGKEYPVFETRFGKVGMMVCYDGFFPEVARELTKNGAEVIAWPVWGCNPLLAKARATENHIYLVSSTYTSYGQNWIVSAVYDHQGEEIALAKEWGDVVVAEVDLDQPTHWSGLGDFKAEMQHRRP